MCLWSAAGSEGTGSSRTASAGMTRSVPFDLLLQQAGSKSKNAVCKTPRGLGSKPTRITSTAFYGPSKSQAARNQGMEKRLHLWTGGEELVAIFVTVHTSYLKK